MEMLAELERVTGRTSIGFNSVRSRRRSVSLRRSSPNMRISMKNQKL